MCLWEGKRPRWSLTIPERFAVTGYKFLSTVPAAREHEGKLRSPYMENVWINGKMSSQVIPRTGNSYGVFAYKRKWHARTGHCDGNYRIVKVKMWGRVLRFNRIHARSSFSRTHTHGGFRAQYAKIVKVY